MPIPADDASRTSCRKRSVVFDFDGTLADTLELGLQFALEQSGRFAKRSISRDDFRSRSMKETISYLELPWSRIPKFVLELKKFLRSNLGQVCLFPGIAEMVQELSNAGFDLYVMSSNARDNIEMVLDRYQLKSCFRGIHSDSSLFGKHVVLNRMVRMHALRKEEMVYVGDEVRDAEACSRAGVRMIAVTWGWNDRQRLQRLDHLLIAESVEELRALVAP